MKYWNSWPVEFGSGEPAMEPASRTQYRDDRTQHHDRNPRRALGPRGIGGFELGHDWFLSLDAWLILAAAPLE